MIDGFDLGIGLSPPLTAGFICRFTGKLPNNMVGALIEIFT